MIFKIRGRRARGREGFTFVEIMVAVIIMFLGASVMVVNLPWLLQNATRRMSRDTSYVYASAKIDELMVGPYSAISTVSSGMEGDFSSLLPGSTDAAQFRWKYTAVEKTPGLLKEVKIQIKASNQADTFTFLVADVRND